MLDTQSQEKKESTIGRNADHRSTWCRGHHKGGISKRQDRKMRKCQGYQDLSGKNRRDDRT